MHPRDGAVHEVLQQVLQHEIILHQQLSGRTLTVHQEEEPRNSNTSNPRTLATSSGPPIPYAPPDPDDDAAVYGYRPPPPPADAAAVGPYLPPPPLPPLPLLIGPDTPDGSPAHNHSQQQGQQGPPPFACGQHGNGRVSFNGQQNAGGFETFDSPVVHRRRHEMSGGAPPAQASSADVQRSPGLRVDPSVLLAQAFFAERGGGQQRWFSPTPTPAPAPPATEVRARSAAEPAPAAAAAAADDREDPHAPLMRANRETDSMVWWPMGPGPSLRGWRELNEQQDGQRERSPPHLRELSNPVDLDDDREGFLFDDAPDEGELDEGGLGDDDEEIYAPHMRMGFGLSLKELRYSTSLVVHMDSAVRALLKGYHAPNSPTVPLSPAAAEPSVPFSAAVSSPRQADDPNQQRPSSKSRSTGVEEGAEGVCAICHEEFETLTLIRRVDKCGHKYHVWCLDVWLEKAHNCPMCRLDLRQSAAQQMKMLDSVTSTNHQHPGPRAARHSPPLPRTGRTARRPIPGWGDLPALMGNTPSPGPHVVPRPAPTTGSHIPNTLRPHQHQLARLFPRRRQNVSYPDADPAPAPRPPAPQLVSSLALSQGASPGSRQQADLEQPEDAFMQAGWVDPDGRTPAASGGAYEPVNQQVPQEWVGDVLSPNGFGDRMVPRQQWDHLLGSALPRWTGVGSEARAAGADGVGGMMEGGEGMNNMMAVDRQPDHIPPQQQGMMRPGPFFSNDWPPFLAPHSPTGPSLQQHQQQQPPPHRPSMPSLSRDEHMLEEGLQPLVNAIAASGGARFGGGFPHQQQHHHQQQEADRASGGMGYYGGQDVGADAGLGEPLTMHQVANRGAPNQEPFLSGCQSRGPSFLNSMMGPRCPSRAPPRPPLQSSYDPCSPILNSPPLHPPPPPPPPLPAIPQMNEPADWNVPYQQQQQNQQQEQEYEYVVPMSPEPAANIPPPPSRPPPPPPHALPSPAQSAYSPSLAHSV
ncbi:unnamed protein product [Vitrella brassicaformis CCMP3155]|uniref:RING-type domain-containing protein n=4 Tax=Vitrella brassicaformis TaxID=1169539 RepID=A0A0G4F0Y0_VITBC|nr:unnamed protein product [Vitrella brassicaformis CCMP3155]|eukprot:CEM05281.1 unnamed protein product [Vitrella brassicaformis CCMP3155]